MEPTLIHRKSYNLLCVAVLSVAGLLCSATRIDAQTKPTDKFEIAPGFLLRDDGVIDIGTAYAEINHYDNHWTIAQQHDRFTVDAPATHEGGGTSIHGTLATGGGAAKVIESIQPSSQGLTYLATFTADHPLESNELGLAVILPLAQFGGKSMQVDGKAVELPLTPAAKGQAVLYTHDAVSELSVPTPKGTLKITGHFDLKLNDDREWNDPRYSLRLLFTPGSGSIQSSKIELKLVLEPAS